MLIEKVLLELTVSEKIFKKHDVTAAEIENCLLNNELIYFKTCKNKYIAFALKERYLTIVFKYERGIAKIITAYPSSKWQIKLYKKKK